MTLTFARGIQHEHCASEWLEPVSEETYRELK